ncbi:MAG: GNAT family N-acetyltransferase [Micromonosporaceae bacterium]|nr:GNAT family N-acetyltransferase [Micromonosporaceae bacterium]
MRLREWDPAAAPAEEIAAWLELYNAVGAHDLPNDPPWVNDHLREYLVETMPGERRTCWVAQEADGRMLGFAGLLVLSDLGVLELYVRPDARGNGVGRALLAAVADRASVEHFSSLGVEAVGGTPAAAFYERYGFTHVYTEMRSILPLSHVDWKHVEEMAAGLVSGYVVQVHVGSLPEALLPAYAEAKQVRRADPVGDMDVRPIAYDADRLRASLHCLNVRGLRPYIVVAIHERTGVVAGLTELVVPAQHPTRADQYDTIIVPAHNSYGLARAIKARMLLELRDRQPQLREVQTWHATDRVQLQQVNKELGFQADREWREYEVDVDELVARLAA